MRCTWLVILFGGFVLCIEHDFKGFDDSILFGIHWPGKEFLYNIIEGEGTEKIANKELSKEIMPVKSSYKEEYECHIPELKRTENKTPEVYDGPSPMTLLKPLFTQKICSYRLESYWSYEVCHGRYVRQYHEEREGKQIKTQEFFLGHWSPEKQAKLEEEMLSFQPNKEPLLTVKVEGQSLPFIEQAMDDGTLCDLSGKPRLTRVRYVCYSHGKHEVYTFKETSTCEYEIIILSPLLCEHPYFKPKQVSENVINCVPLPDYPKKPRSLLQTEVESQKFHTQNIRFMSEKDANDILAVLKLEKISEDGETKLRFELQPIEEDETKQQKVKITADDNHVRAFLDGENCLTGGSGWWKYEFCYGKYVAQYHIDRSGEKTTLILGKYDEDAHIEWIKENKSKAPKPIEQRTTLTHFYSNGDICDKTGKPRSTEVKLKCMENTSSPAQVTLYLLEPRTCHYILGIESAIVCNLLPVADENGLVKYAQPLYKPEVTVYKIESKEKEEKDVPKSDRKVRWLLILTDMTILSRTYMIKFSLSIVTVFL